MFDGLRKLFGRKPTSAEPPAQVSSAPVRPQTVHVTDEDFNQRIVQGDQLAVVDFWAHWCGPCHIMAPVIEALAAELDGRAVVAKLDVDENPTTAARYDILGIPTVIYLQGGVEVDRCTGVTPLSELRRRAEQILNS